MDDFRIGMLRYQIAHLAGHLDDFKNAVAAAIAGAAAPIAAMRFIDRVTGLKAERGKPRIVGDIFRVKIFAGLAAVAKDTDEPLRDRRTQGRLEEKAFHTEVQQA